ncbi:hypothetical protein KQH40_00745 [bacterium]|nr:hypothetical protein [bacterium]
MPAPKANPYTLLIDAIAQLPEHPDAELANRILQAPNCGACSFSGGFPLKIGELEKIEQLNDALHLTAKLIEMLPKLSPAKETVDDHFVF